MQKPDDAVPVPAEGPTGAQVLDYLRRHPDFLARHPELFGADAAEEGVVDLRQVLVRRLQDEVRGLNGEYAELVSTSRANQSHQTRVHAAVLALLEAGSFEHLIEVATSDVAVHVDVDVVRLCVEAADDAVRPGRLRGVTILEPGTVEAALGRKREVLLRPYVVGDPAIFGSASGIVRSDALARLDLGAGAPAGLLALGSRNEGKFLPGHGTELLAFLARTIALSIRSWLDLPD